MPDEVLHAAFDVARFGPQGGNRQPVRWIVVRDAGQKQALADLYLPTWKAYLGAIGSGDVNVGALPRTVQDADYFAEHLRRGRRSSSCAPSWTGCTPPTTSWAGSVVGGGSIYPTVQNFCLALRDQGVGTAVTTLLCHEEPAVRELLQIPDGFLTAAHIAVGYPARAFPTRLTRSPVEEIVPRRRSAPRSSR